MTQKPAFPFADPHGHPITLLEGITSNHANHKLLMMLTCRICRCPDRSLSSPVLHIHRTGLRDEHNHDNNNNNRRRNNNAPSRDATFPVFLDMDDQRIEANELIAPCRCRGTMRWVHRGCLEEWRAACSKAFRECEMCNTRYQFYCEGWKRLGRSRVAIAVYTGVLVMLAVTACVCAATSLRLQLDEVCHCRLSGPLEQSHIIGNVTVRDIVMGLLLVAMFSYSVLQGHPLMTISFALSAWRFCNSRLVFDSFFLSALVGKALWDMWHVVHHYLDDVVCRLLVLKVSNYRVSYCEHDCREHDCKCIRNSSLKSRVEE